MLRILIVDDHPDTADAISMLLSSLGHTTEVAYTGQGGLAAFEKIHPDLVILDVGLPDLSGYDVARAIRDRPDGRGCYIMAATGWGMPEDRVRALAAGFDQHQLKPLDLGKLIGVVANATARLTRAEGSASDRA